jgi:hypothetical protein
MAPSKEGKPQPFKGIGGLKPIPTKVFAQPSFYENEVLI